MAGVISALFLIAAASGSSKAPADGVAWQWDDDTPSCSLFQRTPEARTIYVTRYPGQDISLSFKFRTPRFSTGLYENAAVTLSTGVTVPATVRVYSAENRQYSVLAETEDPALGSGLANATSVTLSHPKFGKFEFTVRALGSAVKALDACDRRKLRGWGVDSDAYWALASRPRPIGDLKSLFSPKLYPAIAMSRNVERNVIAILEVGTDGAVKSCRAPGSAYPQFVDTVCGVLTKGARFEPARDSAGKAVAAPYLRLISFRMAPL